MAPHPMRRRPLRVKAVPEGRRARRGGLLCGEGRRRVAVVQVAHVGNFERRTRLGGRPGERKGLVPSGDQGNRPPPQWPRCRPEQLHPRLDEARPIGRGPATSGPGARSRSLDDRRPLRLHRQDVRDSGLREQRQVIGRKVKTAGLTFDAPDAARDGFVAMRLRKEARR